MKGLELAKVARRDRQEFDCATWLHKARSLPKDQFKREVGIPVKANIDSGGKASGIPE